MNETGETPESETPAPAPHRGSGSWIHKALLVGLVVVVLAYFAGFYGLMPGKPSEPVTAQSVVHDAVTKVLPMPQETAPGDLLQRLEALTERVNRLEAQLGASNPEASAQNRQDMARMQSDMVALSGALSSVQVEVKQAAEAAGQARLAAQTQGALVVAFLQLKTAEASGAPFMTELAFMRRAGAKDAVVAGAVAQLEPLAEKGVASLMDLAAQYAELAVNAEAAVRRAEAKTWKERIWAEIQNLISIRRQNETGEEGSGLAVIARDLAARRLKDALDKADTLPPSAKDVLKSWIESAKERQRLDASMEAMASYLIEGTASNKVSAPETEVETPQPQPEQPYMSEPEADDDPIATQGSAL